MLAMNPAKMCIIYFCLYVELIQLKWDVFWYKNRHIFIDKRKNENVSRQNPS